MMDTQTSSRSSVRSVSALLFCRMCQAVYRQPKLLPCLHSFCRPCLVNLVTQGSDGAIIVCPLCSHKTKLPPTGVTSIQDNCFLGRMCQDYITEVQGHIVARSLYTGSSRSSSEFSALRSKLTEELSHSQYSPSSSFQSLNKKQEDVQHVAQEESFPFKTFHTEHSNANAMEAIHNMDRLQAKILSLQGEALRVTYAIDHVNQCMTEWHQHKEDLKRAVQRRSAQFQFFIKRMEHQLMVQIEGKHVDDEFYTESDKSKTELRKMLKNILHEVSVLKSIQEFGKDVEIHTLISDLLGKSVGMAGVVLKKFHFDMDVPIQTIEENVSACFGNIRLTPVETDVFSPEIIDFNEIKMDNFMELQTEEGSTPHYYDDDDSDASILKDEEIDTFPTNKRSFSDSSSLRSTDKDDAKEHLAQFQNARETLRTRRREILVRGQQAREDEAHRRPRLAMRKGRVQSLDRLTIPVTKKGSRPTLLTKPNVQDIATTYKQHDNKVINPAEGVSGEQHGITFQYGTAASNFPHGHIPEDIHVPSPVIEEVSLPKMHIKKLVKQTSDPHGMLASPEEYSDSEVVPPSHSQSAMEQLSSNRYLTPNTGGTIAGRRHSSDQCNFNVDSTSLDIVSNKAPTRLTRRAISNVADRKAKIEFLRDNWQKRKEILIQNEGFVSPDSIVKHTKSSPYALSPTISATSCNNAVPRDTPQTAVNIYTPSDVASFEHVNELKESTQNHNNDLTNKEEISKEDDVVSSSFSHGKQIFDRITRRDISNFGTKLEETTPSRGTSWITVSSHYPASQRASRTTSQEGTSFAETFQRSKSPILSSTQTATSTSVSHQIPTPQTQETTTDAQTRTTTNRYSRLYSKPIESIDVSSLIAAMYSGKEKTNIQTNGNTTTILSSEPSSTIQDISNTTSTVTTTSNITTTAGNNKTTSSVASTRLSPISYSSRSPNEIPSHTTSPGAIAQQDVLEPNRSQLARRYPYSLSSRNNGGVNRRHTIEIGQSEIQDALKLTSSEKRSHDSSVHTPSPGRYSDHLRNLGSRYQSESLLSPLDEATNSDKINETLKYQLTEETTRTKPSALEVVTGRTISEQSAALEQSTDVLASQSATSLLYSSPQTPPPSPNASDGMQKVRIREIARKKKERWRHLTIH